MRKTWSLTIVGIALIYLVNGDASGAKLGFCANRVNRDTLFQASVFRALDRGMYDGSTTMETLVRNGDFGLGTFDNIDGEMVQANGVIYQIKVDGFARVAPRTLETPFALVTCFESDDASVERNLTFAELQRYIDHRLPSRNGYYAIRVLGAFSHLQVRSIPRQERSPGMPLFPPLAEVVAQQVIFDLRNVKGTMVGFWLPNHVAEVNIPGYHFHFISADGTRGGHVLDGTLQVGKIDIDHSDKLQVVLPKTRLYRDAPLD